MMIIGRNENGLEFNFAYIKPINLTLEVWIYYTVTKTLALSVNSQWDDFF